MKFYIVLLTIFYLVALNLAAIHQNLCTEVDVLLSYDDKIDHNDVTLSVGVMYFNNTNLIQIKFIDATRDVEICISNSLDCLSIDNRIVSMSADNGETIGLMLKHDNGIMNYIFYQNYIDEGSLSRNSGMMYDTGNSSSFEYSDFFYNVTETCTEFKPIQQLPQNELMCIKFASTTEIQDLNNMTLVSLLSDYSYDGSVLEINGQITKSPSNFTPVIYFNSHYIYINDSFAYNLSIPDSGRKLFMFLADRATMGIVPKSTMINKLILIADQTWMAEAFSFSYKNPCQVFNSQYYYDDKKAISNVCCREFEDGGMVTTAEPTGASTLLTGTPQTQQSSDFSASTMPISTSTPTSDAKNLNFEFIMFMVIAIFKFLNL